MKIEEKPPEKPGGNPCPACGSQLASLPAEKHPAPAGGIPDVDRSVLSLLELENSGLRRLVVELLEKNQQLRERLQAISSNRNSGIAADLRLVSDQIAS